MEDGGIEAFLQLTGTELAAILLIISTRTEICFQIFRKKILVSENQNHQVKIKQRKIDVSFPSFPLGICFSWLCTVSISTK